MKSIIFFITTLILSGAQAQFMATMENVKSGEKEIYEVRATKDRYRYDFTENGQKMIVIVMPGACKAFVILPEKELYVRQNCNDMMIVMNDPVQSYAYSKEYYGEKAAGKETVEGLLCEKREIYASGQKFLTVWYSEKLGFPVRITNHLKKDTHMNLKDIRPWKAEPSLFEVPDGYAEVDERMRPVIPEPPPPEKWTTHSVSIPYEGIVKRGNIIKTVIPESVYYKFITTNTGETPTKYTYHLYRNDEKLPEEIAGNDDVRTRRLYMEERKTQTMDWKEGWELVIEVYEGEVKVQVYPE